MFRDISDSAPDKHGWRAGRSFIAVIGIDRYEHWQRLSNAVSDAEGTLRAFCRLGFEPVGPPLLDQAATADAIRALVTERLAKLTRSDSLVVFFAGHGHTNTRTFDEGDSLKTGYLIPVDGDAPEVSMARWIRIDSWLSDIAQLEAKHVLIFIDACHSGIALGSLIKWRGAGPSGKSLERLNSRRSRRVITSALDDERALDSGPLPGHSLFTGCLLAALDGDLAPHGTLVTGSQIGLYLQQRVSSQSQSQQTPDFGALEQDRRGEMLLRIAAEHPLADGANPTADAVTIGIPDEPVGRKRLAIVNREVFNVAFGSLLFSASLATYILFRVFIARPAFDFRIAATGVPLAVIACAVRGLFARRLFWRGLFQRPRALLAVAGVLAGLAVLPGLFFVAIDNRTDRDVPDAHGGALIERGRWITGTPGELRALDGAYCIEPATRRAGSLIEAILPTATLSGVRRRWQVLGAGLSADERNSLRGDGGAVTRELDVLVDSCTSMAASASLEIAGAMVHLPYGWRISRPGPAEAHAMVLDAGPDAGALDTSFAVISGPGQLRCNGGGRVTLEKWQIRDAVIERWNLDGVTSSQWRGASDVAWACRMVPPQRMTLDVRTPARGDIAFELPVHDGVLALVTVDGASVACAVAGGPESRWVIERRTRASYRARLPGPVNIPVDGGTAGLQIIGDGVALYCGPAGKSVFDVERKPAPGHFCFYVGDRATEGPCPGDRCPRGCNLTRDALRQRDLPSDRCRIVCDCEKAPTCVQ